MRDDMPWWAMIVFFVVVIAVNLGMLAGAVWLIVVVLRAMGVIG